jgi:two-component system, NtrC family, response regulator AtoC
VLRAHEWPGNIRELQNTIERAAILCDRNTIEVRDLNVGAATRNDALADAVDLSGTLDEATQRTTRVVERMKITDALARTNSRTEAADALGITPRTLAAKMKELKIDE